MKPLATLISPIDDLDAAPGRAAVVAMTADGGRTLARGALHGEIRQLAAGLARRFAPGDILLLLAPECPEWIIAALAAIRAGAVVAPVDVQVSAENLAHMLADSAACLVLTTSDHFGRFADCGIPVALLDAPADDPRSFHAFKGMGSLPQPKPEDLAVLFYTSGTTGRPKGVPLTHANLAFQINTIAATRMLNPTDRILLPLPLHHVYPFVVGMLTPIAQGLPLIIPEALTGPQVVRALKEGEATVMIGVPRLYEALYAAIGARVEMGGRMAGALFERLLAASVWLRRHLGRYAGQRLFRPLHARFAPRLRLLACGGAAIDPELVWRLEGLGWRMAIGYGLTETSSLVTMNLPPSPRPDSVGRPVPGVEIRIGGVSGGEGEILVRGPNVFVGYLNQTEKTREAFTGEGWFRTGDLGRLENGWLVVTGRVKELIVTPGGENIQPEEVERVFCTHPFIQAFALLEWKGRLAGLVMPEPAAILRAGFDDIQAAIRKAVDEINPRLPSYQRIADFAITRHPLPLTRLGKLRRYELPRYYAEAKAGGRGPSGPLPLERMAEADRLLLQDSTLRGVWDWLARRFPDQYLAPDTSFRLDLGMDSLSWLEVAVEVQRLTGVELSERVIAEIETVRDLLRAVENAPRTARVVSWERPEEVLSSEDLARVRPHRGILRLAHRSLAVLIHLLMRAAYRLRVNGLEHLPAGQFVLTPNHLSFLDPFVIAAALPPEVLERTCWAGWTGVAFTNPVTRFFSRIARVLPIEPAKEALRSLAFTAAALQQGNHLVLFPEGQRSPSGRLQPLRPGLGLLVSRFPVPVVPVYIAGTFDAWPVGRKLPRLFLPVTVTFGPPLDPRDFLSEEADRNGAAGRITRALAERLAAMVEPQKPPPGSTGPGGGCARRS